MSGIYGHMNCTCKDTYAAEVGRHEGTCPLSVMHTGALWYKPIRAGEWERAPFVVDRSTEEERLNRELTALRQQVKRLRAALEELVDATPLPLHNNRQVRAFGEAVTALAATQPQEVQP